MVTRFWTSIPDRPLAWAAACVAAGLAVPILAFGLLNAMGEAFAIQTWFGGDPIPLRILVWTIPVLACAFLIGHLTRANAFRFGLAAGVSAALCLMAIATKGEFAQGESIAPLAKFLLPELTLTLLLLPLASLLFKEMNMKKSDATQGPPASELARQAVPLNSSGKSKASRKAKS
jgi:hypothetical protein